MPPAESPCGDAVPTLNNTNHTYLGAKRGTGRFVPATARDTRYTLEDFAEHVGPKTALSRVRRSHVESYLGSLNVAASTKGMWLSRVRSFFTWCQAHDLVRRNPCAGVEGPRRPQATARDLKRDEVRRLLDIADERLAVAVLLGAQEGLRRVEMVRLSTTDVDWDDRTIRVHGKGDKERLVPMSDETAEAIGDYLTACPASPYQPLLRSYMRPAEGISPGRLGHLLSELMGQAGVKRRPFDGKSAHALRHTCANDMLDADADLRDVQEMLGHEKLSTTANVYARRMAVLGRLRSAAASRTYGT
jgi:site-specific recombinase XerD